MGTRVIGLMSGTSVDGIDAALVEISGLDLDLQVTFVAGETYPYPDSLRSEILEVCGGKALSMAQMAALDDAIALQFAQVVNRLQVQDNPVHLIGSHGQTVFHRPPTFKDEGGKLQGQMSLGYSLQLGRGEVIAQQTGLPTVNNFRVADIAAGGEGAPLVPKVDAYLLSHPTQSRCVQNLGGIGNVTYLPARTTQNWQEKVYGWDTGPGNVLLDLAIAEITQGQQHYDSNGNRASQGTPCQELVNQWLQQDFFQKPPPKSTGRELFSPAYLHQCWQDAQPYHLTPEDWLATLTELTVASIAHSYRTFLPCLPDEVLLCGGGSRNQYLKQRLQDLLQPTQVVTTDERGMNGEFKEAIAFAVLAYWRFHCSFPGNLPQVTGAKQPMLLGDTHRPYKK